MAKPTQAQRAAQQRKRNSALMASMVAPPAPAAPAAATPFWTGDDLAAVNGFNTDYATQLANIDFTLGELESDTKMQTGQVNSGAKKNTADTQDDAAARGIFQSSIKDAAVYDIEAQRALQTKFLDDKLTAARLNSGTQKKILSDSKTAFDKAMLQKQAENAQSANDVAAAAWAEAKAAHDAARPVIPAAPSRPAAAPGRPSTPVKGVSRPTSAQASNQASYAASRTRTNQAAAAARARAKRGR